jgi:hypothetical protein
MNGDTLAVMQAISDSRNELTKAIGDLHSEFSSHKANIDVRVQAIEDDQKSAKVKQYIHSIVVFLGSAIHHDLGQWLHWKL